MVGMLPGFAESRGRHQIRGRVDRSPRGRRVEGGSVVLEVVRRPSHMADGGLQVSPCRHLVEELEQKRTEDHVGWLAAIRIIENIRDQILRYPVRCSKDVRESVRRQNLVVGPRPRNLAKSRDVDRLTRTCEPPVRVKHGCRLKPRSTNPDRIRHGLIYREARIGGRIAMPVHQTRVCTSTHTWNICDPVPCAL